MELDESDLTLGDNDAAELLDEVAGEEEDCRGDRGREGAAEAGEAVGRDGEDKGADDERGGRHLDDILVEVARLVDGDEAAETLGLGDRGVQVLGRGVCEGHFLRRRMRRRRRKKRKKKERKRKKKKKK